MKEFLLHADIDDANMRLDLFLARRFSPEYSRSYFQGIIAEQHVQLNGRVVDKRHCLVPGDAISVRLPPKPQLSLEPENIPLDILYEDDDLLVINKPAGIVVHPAPGHHGHTIVNALLHYCKALQPIDDEDMRPGIVHRLDKETSGVLLIAKNVSIQHQLMALFAERKVKKIYRALCIGKPSCTVIEQPIARHPVHRKKMAVRPDGRAAVTHVRVLASNGIWSWVELSPITGRTHQIRVHLQSIGVSIFGDSLYGNPSLNKKWKSQRLCLHAVSIEFIHPKTKKTIVCNAPLPDDISDFLQIRLPCALSSNE